LHSVFLEENLAGAGGTSQLKYQSKTICEHKNVSYEAQLCPIIVMVQRAPNAQSTLQIVNRHYEDHKSRRLDSQILKRASLIDALTDTTLSDCAHI
jgi:hypothetical protein